VACLNPGYRLERWAASTTFCSSTFVTYNVCGLSEVDEEPAVRPDVLAKLLNPLHPLGRHGIDEAGLPRVSMIDD
jgi:hypothetical protein